MLKNATPFTDTDTTTLDNTSHRYKHVRITENNNNNDSIRESVDRIGSNPSTACGVLSVSESTLSHMCGYADPEWGSTIVHILRPLSLS